MRIEKPLTHAKFISDVERFCDRYGFASRDIGKAALNDTAFLTRIKAGKSPTLARIEKVYDYMAAFIAETESTVQSDRE